MHPLWQIRQVVTVDSTERHVDRRNNFGNRAGGRVYGAFAGLMLWIAIVVKLIEDLLGYVDDDFSWDFEDNLVWYAPYERFYPGKQTRLLEFWDELGVPHEKKKQEWGAPLTIIGFSIDPNAMTITMPLEARLELISAIKGFARHGQRWPLREYQRLAGWINWSLNAYPLLRPGLSMLYFKMAGKSNPHEPVWVNRALCGELLWVARHLEDSDGIHMLESVEWSAEEADVTWFTDACPSGLGLWSPRENIGFHHAVTDDEPRPIFFYEALAVLSALHKSFALTTPHPRRVVVYCDNTNTVDMFNTLHAKPEYNPILLTAVGQVLGTHSSFRVFHIPGEQNVVSDALSRHHYGTAVSAAPGITTLPFEPPQLTSGAAAQ
jgi:hypothetical protein